MASAQARQQLPLRTPSSAWGTACPPLCAVRGAPDDLLLGPGPSLQILRRRFPALVRTLRRYYGPVRLLGGVRVGRAAVAFSHRPATSRQAPPRSPGSRAGSFLTCTGSATAPGSHAACDSATVDMAFPFCPQGRHPNLGISRLNRRPASASVNASPAMSPSPAHDSRSAWFPTPSLWGSFIPYSPPVYPGAFGQPADFRTPLALKTKQFGERKSVAVPHFRPNTLLPRAAMVIFGARPLLRPCGAWGGQENQLFPTTGSIPIRELRGDTSARNKKVGRAGRDLPQFVPGNHGQTEPLELYPERLPITGHARESLCHNRQRFNHAGADGLFPAKKKLSGIALWLGFRVHWSHDL